MQHARAGGPHRASRASSATLSSSSVRAAAYVTGQLLPVDGGMLIT